MDNSSESGSESRLEDSLPVLAVLAGLLVVASVTSWGEPIATSGDPGFDQIYRAVAVAAFCVGLVYAVLFALGFWKRERERGARVGAAAVEAGKVASP